MCAAICRPSSRRLKSLTLCHWPATDSYTSQLASTACASSKHLTLPTTRQVVTEYIRRDAWFSLLLLLLYIYLFLYFSYYGTRRCSTLFLPYLRGNLSQCCGIRFAHACTLQSNLQFVVRNLTLMMLTSLLVFLKKKKTLHIGAAFPTLNTINPINNYLFPHALSMFVCLLA